MGSLAPLPSPGTNSSSFDHSEQWICLFSPSPPVADCSSTWFFLSIFTAYTIALPGQWVRLHQSLQQVVPNYRLSVAVWHSSFWLLTARHWPDILIIELANGKIRFFLPTPTANWHQMVFEVSPPVLRETGSQVSGWQLATISPGLCRCWKETKPGRMTREVSASVMWPRPPSCWGHTCALFPASRG